MQEYSGDLCGSIIISGPYFEKTNKAIRQTSPILCEPQI